MLAAKKEVFQTDRRNIMICVSIMLTSKLCENLQKLNREVLCIGRIGFGFIFNEFYLIDMYNFNLFTDVSIMRSHGKCDK